SHLYRENRLESENLSPSRQPERRKTQSHLSPAGKVDGGGRRASGYHRGRYLEPGADDSSGAVSFSQLYRCSGEPAGRADDLRKLRDAYAASGKLQGRAAAAVPEKRLHRFQSAGSGGKGHA